MSDDEADPELVALLRERLGLGEPSPNAPPETKVLKHAEYIADNSVDVALDMYGTKYAAALVGNGLAKRMAQKQARAFDISAANEGKNDVEMLDSSKETEQKEQGKKTEEEEDWIFGGWHSNPMHPPSSWPAEDTLKFVFTLDLLNFSFWSELPEDKRFSIEYNGKKWTGYLSLVAALRRALDEGYPITTPLLWHHHEDCPDELWEYFFRSATDEPMPLLKERIAILREAADVLYKDFEMNIENVINQANQSAAGLVNLLVDHFPNFRDQSVFERKTVQFYKRAQILVAYLWSAFRGEGYGKFNDIEKLTMFADYRVPQILRTLGALNYAPALDDAIKRKKEIPSGHSWEVQIRGCTIWCVEMIRRQVMREHQGINVNAVLIDFFLYDLAKELEAKGQEQLPHHRTRSIWY